MGQGGAFSAHPVHRKRLSGSMSHPLYIVIAFMRPKVYDPDESQLTGLSMGARPCRSLRGSHGLAANGRTPREAMGKSAIHPRALVLHARIAPRRPRKRRER